jgi:hypothetical protein
MASVRVSGRAEANLPEAEVTGHPETKWDELLAAKPTFQYLSIDATASAADHTEGVKGRERLSVKERIPGVESSDKAMQSK